MGSETPDRRPRRGSAGDGCLDRGDDPGCPRWSRSAHRL